MDNEISLRDISDDLFILNKMTIEKIFELENFEACLALYSFYYKTAKWQKTNTIKANDTYVSKCLKWGKDKITKTKNTLKENGLINIVQRRKDGKIEGWYIEVSYLVSPKKLDDVKIKIESNNPCEQELEKATSCFQDTNALKDNIINALKEEIKMLKNENQNKNKIDAKDEKLKSHFELIWKIYPRKTGGGKTKAYTYFLQWLSGRSINKTTIKLTDAQMYRAVKKYADECNKQEKEEQYIKLGSTFFNTAILDYIDEENNNE